jgi:hypothetical protein
MGRGCFLKKGALKGDYVKLYIIPLMQNPALCKVNL